MKKKGKRPTADWYEAAARAENEWVLAVVLKQDHPLHPKALEIAVRAADMARDALGERHEAYGIALLNLGLFYTIAENATACADAADTATRQALEVLGEYHPYYAEALYWLGIHHFNETKEPEKAMAAWTTALGIHRRRAHDPLKLARLLICLSCYHIEGDIRRATPLLAEALQLQRKTLGVAHEETRDTEFRLAEVLRTIAERSD